MKARRIIAIAAIGLASVTAAGGTALAADNHAAPGTPGDANCKGQTTAYLAQVLKDAGAPGIGGVASLTGLTVKEIKAIVDTYCG